MIRPRWRLELGRVLAMFGEGEEASEEFGKAVPASNAAQFELNVAAFSTPLLDFLRHCATYFFFCLLPLLARLDLGVQLLARYQLASRAGAFLLI